MSPTPDQPQPTEGERLCAEWDGVQQQKEDKAIEALIAMAMHPRSELIAAKVEIKLLRGDLAKIMDIVNAAIILLDSNAIREAQDLLRAAAKEGAR